MIVISYDEAYARYTERFEHTEIEDGESITYRPESICNHKELDEIFQMSNSLAEALTTMRERVGSSYSLHRGR